MATFASKSDMTEPIEQLASNNGAPGPDANSAAVGGASVHSRKQGRKSQMQNPYISEYGESRASEFQAVIIIDYDDTIFPLTENRPKCLLPIANRPLLSYQLDMLTASGVQETFITAPEEYEEELASYLSRYVSNSEQQGQMSMNMAVELITVPDLVGSADGLRAVSERLRGDFICLSSDTICQFSLGELATLHRQSTSDVIMMCTMGGAAAGLGAKKDVNADLHQEYVGITDQGRVVLKTPRIELDEYIEVQKALLYRCGGSGLTIRTDMIDVGVYIFSHWVKDFLLDNPKISNLKNDLVAFLIKRQFQSREKLLQMMPAIGNRTRRPLSALEPWLTTFAGDAATITSSYALMHTAALTAANNNNSNTSSSSNNSSSGVTNSQISGGAGGVSFAGTSDEGLLFAVRDSLAEGYAAMGGGGAGAVGGGASSANALLNDAGLSTPVAVSGGGGGGGGTTCRESFSAGSIGSEGALSVDGGAKQAGHGLDQQEQQQVAYSDLLRCFALVYNMDSKLSATSSLATGGALLQRIMGVPAYLNVNREIAVHTSCSRVPWAKFSNYLKKEMSLVGAGSEVGQKTTIKQSCIGSNCKIGEMTKLNNCVVMDNVTIGECCTIQNTVLCDRVVIEKGCNLNECTVGADYLCTSGTKVKNEALSGSGL